MPELPEVETVRRGLESLLHNASPIARAEFRRRDLRRPIPRGAAQKLKGQCLKSFRRRAKFLLMDTENHTVVSHLGMTGSWRLDEQRRDHDHIVLHLEDGRQLAYHDPRRFGLFEVFPKFEEGQSTWLKNLGPEPLDQKHFHGDYLFEKSRKRNVAVKNFIMDQKIVVGVGNIYASEALFRAGIRPTTRAGRISRARWQSLAHHIGEVLKAAIDAGGTTLKDFRQAGGSEGYFQVRLDVYDREGQLCTKCHSPIKNTVIGQRSSYWCPQCQRP